jgi:hypothetical protein
MSSRPSFLGPGDRMGTFTVDLRLHRHRPGMWEPFIDTWSDRMGDRHPWPELSASTIDGFQGTMPA